MTSKDSYFETTSLEQNQLSLHAGNHNYYQSHKLKLFSNNSIHRREVAIVERILKNPPTRTLEEKYINQ